MRWRLGDGRYRLGGGRRRESVGAAGDEAGGAMGKWMRSGQGERGVMVRFRRWGEGMGMEKRDEGQGPNGEWR